MKINNLVGQQVNAVTKSDEEIKIFFDEDVLILNLVPFEMKCVGCVDK